VGWTQKDEDAGNDANTVAHKNGGKGDGADVALKFGQATTGSWGVHCSSAERFEGVRRPRHQKVEGDFSILTKHRTVLFVISY
jgi:hypothetical protein